MPSANSGYEYKPTGREAASAAVSHKTFDTPPPPVAVCIRVQKFVRPESPRYASAFAPLSADTRNSAKIDEIVDVVLDTRAI